MDGKAGIDPVKDVENTKQLIEALQQRFLDTWQSADALPSFSFPELKPSTARLVTVILSEADEPEWLLTRRKEEASHSNPKAAHHVISLPAGHSRDLSILLALSCCARTEVPVLLIAGSTPPPLSDDLDFGSELVQIGDAGDVFLISRPSPSLAAYLARSASALEKMLLDPIIVAFATASPGVLLSVALNCLPKGWLEKAPPPLLLEVGGYEPVTPSFGLLNKQYREPPFEDDRQRKILAHVIQALGMHFKTNSPADADAFLADEMLVWFRHLGFLKDQRFQTALGPYREDKILRARLWRLHTLCWAAQSCAKLPGDFSDFGTYDGRSMDVVMRFMPGMGQGRRWWLYDLFENPPDEARKALHGPELEQAVSRQFKDRPWVHVIGGKLPNTFLAHGPKSIAFMHLDLNHADAEIACLEAVFDRLVSGGMIVLDDFGFQRYGESHRAHRAFFDKHNHPVLELPTGQGLVVKRAS